MEGGRETEESRRERERIERGWRRCRSNDGGTRVAVISREREGRCDSGGGGPNSREREREREREWSGGGTGGGGGATAAWRRRRCNGDDEVRSGRAEGVTYKYEIEGL